MDVITATMWLLTYRSLQTVTFDGALFIYRRYSPTLAVGNESTNPVDSVCMHYRLYYDRSSEKR